MSYAQKLKDPRWQKKRLEVMTKAGWKCEDCGRDDRELSIHHLRYITGLQPWEHSNDLLKCLCQEECHLKRQKLEQSIQTIIARFLRDVPVEDLEDLMWSLIEDEADRCWETMNESLQN